MKLIIFIFFYFLLIAYPFQNTKAQDWESFLNRYVDNLHHADSAPGIGAQYTREVVSMKKQELLNSIYTSNRNLFSGSGGHNNPALYPTHTVFSKDQMSAINAAISLGTASEQHNARNRLYNTMLNHGFDGKGSGTDFISTYVSYILNVKPDVITGDKETDLRNYYAENSGNIWGRHFWEYNTENHAQMYRSTTYGIGLKWPDHTFIVRTDNSRESGTYMANQIENNHIKKYIRYLYKYGMGENLSPIYLGHHTGPWTTFYELAKKYDRQTSMEVAGGILEYYYALTGLNNQHKMYAGTINRVRTSLGSNYNYDGIARIMGGYRITEPVSRSVSSIVAESDYMPHIRTRALIAGDIRMPYSFMQVTARNGWYQNQVRMDDRNPNFVFNNAYAKTVFRYVYTDRQYSIGSGNIKVLPGDDPDYKDGIAGSATWQNGFMIFSSPQVHTTENWGNKFFEDHKTGYSGNVGNDSWVGYSPYMEMAQFENTVLVYCVIPPSESHRIAQIHLSTPLAHGGELIERNDENRTWYIRYRALDGFVYIAVIPLHFSAENHQTTGFRNMERIVDNGAQDDGHCGYVVEMAHSSELSFDDFKENVDGLRLSWDKKNATMTYTNRRGHVISLQHSSRTSRNDKLPTINITPFDDYKVEVNWEEYPVVRSPYMRIVTEDNREKMIINDNEGGIKVDYVGTGVQYLDCNDYLPENLLSPVVPADISFKFSLTFVEEYSGDPIPNAEIKLNGSVYTTDNHGNVEIDDLKFGVYGIEFNKKGYSAIEKFGIVLRSDTTLTLQVPLSPPLVNLHIVNASTGVSVDRAMVHFNGKQISTSSNGIASLGELSSNELKFTVTHNNFFNYTDSLLIDSDTTMTIKLTSKMANVIISVRDEDVPLPGMQIRFSSWTVNTDGNGMAYFFYQPARVKYEYEVSGGGYQPITDSLYLELDTTLNINMSPLSATGIYNSVSFKIFPNPVNEILEVSLDSPPYQNLEIMIYDMLGNKLVETKTNERNSILKLGHLENGVYFINLLKGSDFNHTEKFVVRR